MLEASGLEPLPWPYQAMAAEDIYRASIGRGLGDTTVLLAGQGPRTDVREMGAAELVTALARAAADRVARYGPAPVHSEEPR